MEIISARVGTPETEPWLARWFSGWSDVHDAALSHGRPRPTLWSVEERLVALRRTERSHSTVVLAAVEAGQVVGGASLELPVLDNLSVAHVSVVVAPGARRQGVGQALLEAVRDEARAAGRASLMTQTERPADIGQDGWPGCAFAASAGLSMRLENVRRDLAVPMPNGRRGRLEAEAAAGAADYTLDVWEGPTPDPARHAALVARMTTDAPLGALDYEPEAWDAERVVSDQQRQVAQGRRWWTAVATDPAGEWVGFSELGWSAHMPERFWQWDTLVVTEHRGHRLGLALKLATLAAAGRELPGAGVVHTWNAGFNAPMVAVNEAMGYQVAEVLEEWQGPV